MRTSFTRLIVSLFFTTLCFKGYTQGVKQLWGTSPFGGSAGYGTIFSLDSSGNHFKTRYSFEVQNPGFGQNFGSKLTPFNGKLYGTTVNGGGNPGVFNIGVLFEWDPASNTYTKRVDLPGTASNLALYNGKLYGVIYYDSSTPGYIFEYDPATNTFTKRSDLPNPSSFNLTASDLTAYNGKFYGTVAGGGSDGAGLIYEWDPANNTIASKTEFNGTNGAQPSGALALRNAKFYGVTSMGGNDNGGVIFEWDPSTNVLTKKFDFAVSFLSAEPSSATGFSPTAALTFSGTKYYGLTTAGGANNGGVLFQWDPVTNVFAKKFDFNTTSGMKPYGELAVNSGKLYGLTREGAAYGGGSIFEWDPSVSLFINKIDLDPVSGSNSYGGLVYAGGMFYGMTDHGGINYNGVLFQWEATGNTYTKKIDLRLSKGLFPASGFAYSNGKLYGLTGDGLNKDRGSLFEWNTGNSGFSQKIDFATVNGQIPSANPDINPALGAYPASSLAAKDGKYYGITAAGGSNDAGVIYEWDPSTSVYSKKLDLSTGTGPTPSIETNKTAGMVLDNDRFYGTLPDHGNTAQGEIFEWNPSTNVYTSKFNFTQTEGSFPNATIVLYNGKYYGTTITGGVNDAGVLFEWNPATNVYTKKLDFAKDANGYWPKAGLILENGKMYGSTYAGGTNDLGVLFEWDPATDTYTKKIDCDAANGSKPFATMTLSGQKLYGLAAKGGANNYGVVFEWDPVNNAYSVKHHFNGTDGQLAFAENDAIFYNGLVSIPAPVASGTPGSCASYSPIIIDNTNNNTWVPLTDEDGNVIAEIKGNGNNLGTINYSLFVNNGPVREDGNHRLYLDRNLTITPQTQPSTPVDIRLYIKEEEFQALRNATNSQGQASGVTTINDVGFFKNETTTCSSSIQQAAVIFPATGQAYDNGYVITASIPSFSSFYFAKNTFTALPVDLLEFNVKTVGNDVQLHWVSTSASGLLPYEIERSEDGRKFKAIGKVEAIALNNSYGFTDRNVTALGAGDIYYRLKQTGIGSGVSYSKIIRVDFRRQKLALQVYPNPADNELGLLFNTYRKEQFRWSITDNSGRILLEGMGSVAAGTSNIVLNIAGLTKGIYSIHVRGTVINETMKFIKR